MPVLAVVPRVLPQPLAAAPEPPKMRVPAVVRVLVVVTGVLSRPFAAVPKPPKMRVLPAVVTQALSRPFVPVPKPPKPPVPALLLAPSPTPLTQPTLDCRQAQPPRC